MSTPRTSSSVGVRRVLPRLPKRAPSIVFESAAVIPEEDESASEGLRSLLPPPPSRCQRSVTPEPAPSAASAGSPLLRRRAVEWAAVDTKAAAATAADFSMRAVVQQTTAESNLNSLECWDYSVELECLQGPDGTKTRQH